jgi:D-serine deaminase-like pyridoxal phosphate-dependent protein
VVGFEERQKVSAAAIKQLAETRELLGKAGFDADTFSGGSTGTYNIDSDLPGITELQVGSYVFMDVGYRQIGSKNGDKVYTDFRPSLTVVTTVVSATHPDKVTVDAGIKAFATDVPYPPETKDRPGIQYRRAGDEFGSVTALEGGKLPAIGERLEFLVPHCDPTVNLYDRICAIRNGKVEAVWPIVARREFAG